MMLGAAIGAAALAYHRPPNNPAAPRAPGALLDGAQIDRQTRQILERACRNCHSDRTESPWYGNVPPASWLIHHDVAQARDHLNLSLWNRYTDVEKQALLSAIGAAVRSRTMPPGRYTLLHPADALSAPDRERVYRWTRAERLRLRLNRDPAQDEGDTRFLWDRRF